MTENKTLTFEETLRQLDTIGGLKNGDQVPLEFWDVRTGFWGFAVARMAYSAASYIREQSKRMSDLLRYNNEFEERARQAERVMKDLHKARPLEEWHEDHGDVLWWKFPVTEAPYCGSPLDLGHTVELHAQDAQHKMARMQVGGWPGYHTHWTPLPHTPLIEKSLK